MKNSTLLLVLLFGFLMSSCEKCECLEEEEEIIIPPVEICDTGLLLMRSIEIGQPLFSLDSVSKPLEMPLIFQNIREDAQDDSQFDVFNRPSNYDAYDAANNTYYIEFPLQQRLYKYDIPSQTRQELIVAGFYSAPVFNNGSLYTISIDNFGTALNPANYAIETINTLDGSLTSLTTNSFNLESFFDWERMSSVSDKDGTIYFLSGSNLVTFNSATMATQQIELTPGFNFTNNYQIFYGLELRENGNLLAIRERSTDEGEALDIVELNTNNLAENPTVIFDLMGDDIRVNSEFYSTTYDSCDDTYYITSRNYDDFDTSDIFEIDLSESTFKTENFDFYLMGIESKDE